MQSYWPDCISSGLIARKLFQILATSLQGLCVSMKIVNNFRYISLGMIENSIAALDIFLDLILAEEPKVVRSKKLSDREIIITSFPWITFCQLMLVTVQRGSKSHFKSLLNQFETELSYDDFLKDVIYRHLF